MGYKDYKEIVYLDSLLHWHSFRAALRSRWSQLTIK